MVSVRSALNNSLLFLFRGGMSLRWKGGEILFLWGQLNEVSWGNFGHIVLHV